MKDIGTLIYIAIILISLFGGFIGNRKKKQAKRSYTPPKKTPQPQQRKKSLEDILQEISSGFEEPKPTVPEPQPQEEYQPIEYESLEETSVIIEDTEDPEVLAMDTDEDHHVHGLGFDIPLPDMYKTEEGESFKIRDWKQAIIASEILKRPEY